MVFVCDDPTPPAGSLRRLVGPLFSLSTPKMAALRPTPPNVEHAELLAELPEYSTARDGKRYLVRVWGGPRPAGTWAGWLEFVSLDGTEIKRTGQETSQPDRDKVLYWTTGLGP